MRRFLSVPVFGLVAVWLALAGCSQEPAPQPKMKKQTISHVPLRLKGLAKSAKDFYAKGQFDEAAAVYRHMLKEEPDLLYAKSNLGLVLVQQKYYGQAVHWLLEAEKQAPRNAFTLSVLGLAYLQQGELEQAVAKLKKAVELDPENARTKEYLEIARKRLAEKEAGEEPPPREVPVPAGEQP